MRELLGARRVSRLSNAVRYKAIILMAHALPLSVDIYDLEGIVPSPHEGRMTSGDVSQPLARFFREHDVHKVLLGKLAADGEPLAGVDTSLAREVYETSDDPVLAAMALLAGTGNHVGRTLKCVAPTSHAELAYEEAAPRFGRVGAAAAVPNPDKEWRRGSAKRKGREVPDQGQAGASAAPHARLRRRGLQGGDPAALLEDDMRVVKPLGPPLLTVGNETVTTLCVHGRFVHAEQDDTAPELKLRFNRHTGQLHCSVGAQEMSLGLPSQFVRYGGRTDLATAAYIVSNLITGTFNLRGETYEYVSPLDDERSVEFVFATVEEMEERFSPLMRYLHDAMDRFPTLIHRARSVWPGDVTYGQAEWYVWERLELFTATQWVVEPNPGPAAQVPRRELPPGLNSSDEEEFFEIAERHRKLKLANASSGDSAAAEESWLPFSSWSGDDGEAEWFGASLSRRVQTRIPKSVKKEEAFKLEEVIVEGEDDDSEKSPAAVKPAKRPQIRYDQPATSTTQIDAMMISSQESPPGPKPRASDGSDDRRRLSRNEGRVPRAAKRSGLVRGSLLDGMDQLKGENDALREMLRDEREHHEDRPMPVEAKVDEYVLAREELRDGPENDCTVFYFNGSVSWDEDGSVSYRFGPEERLVRVSYKNGVCRIFGVAGLSKVAFHPSLLSKAARIGATVSSEKRVPLIANFMSRDEDSCKFDDKLISEFPSMLASMTLRPFILAGITTATQKIMTGNHFDALVPDRYTVTPREEDVTRLERQVKFHDDIMPYRAKLMRSARMGPLRVHGVAPQMPDAADAATMLAGIAKRLMPDRPVVREEALNELEGLVDEFIRIARGAHCRMTDDELLEDVCRGRPVREAEELRVGWHAAREDPAAEIAASARAPYKAFVKSEAYPSGSEKPPRFIMTLPLRDRGVQAFFLRRILARIEEATLPCNVKHLTSEGITRKLRRKFEDVAQVCETDYTAFESSVSPLIKAYVENRIFRELAESDEAVDYVTRVLGRRHVHVIGPSFQIPAMPHIRMSGDQHTSIGNLVTNIIVSAYAARRSVRWMIENGLFEGDDGVFPLDRGNCELMASRAAELGFSLKIDVGRWESLSFCGKNFVAYEGEEYVGRNPERMCVSLTTLFAARQDTDQHDRMLQRSKALSVLANQYCPYGSGLAAIIEFVTRDAPVSEVYLSKNGLLKEYSPYGLEGCIPGWLANCQTAERLAEEVSRREALVGGIWTKRQVFDAVVAAWECKEMALPMPFRSEKGTTFMAGFEAHPRVRQEVSLWQEVVAERLSVPTSLEFRARRTWRTNRERTRDIGARRFGLFSWLMACWIWVCRLVKRPKTREDRRLRALVLLGATAVAMFAMLAAVLGVGIKIADRDPGGEFSPTDSGSTSLIVAQSSEEIMTTVKSHWFNTVCAVLLMFVLRLFGLSGT